MLKTILDFIEARDYLAVPLTDHYANNLHLAVNHANAPSLNFYGPGALLES